MERIEITLSSIGRVDTLNSVLCARGKSRTYDRPSISRVLYQLSYARLVEPLDTSKKLNIFPLQHKNTKALPGLCVEC